MEQRRDYIEIEKIKEETQQSVKRAQRLIADFRSAFRKTERGRMQSKKLAQQGQN